ncbi:uncharacterized protein LOC116339883 [Contarinia nasturtii]|uniref:uncharacterized protein LOC116339883 n=1 Tax=Contarinia nasturtii TaxID=265458 RepID=UPI0012D459B6|nr:uncharacterized protein LOC116339883 [Contarinia nasturtii]
MSSSSSDSEDENLALLRQAVDTNFISDDMFTTVASSANESTPKDTEDIKLSAKIKPIKPTTSGQPLKSQRYIENDEITADLNVPKSMQDFVYKKMSKKINDSVEFIETPTKEIKNEKTTNDDFNCLRLLNDTEPIKIIDLMPQHDIQPNGGKKFEIKRRIIEADEYTDEEKLKMASIGGDSILEQTETKGWKAKKVKPNKMYKYREKNSVLYAVEEENEFTALRKKNNWSESKIGQFPWKNHKTKY